MKNALIAVLLAVLGVLTGMQVSKPADLGQATQGLASRVASSSLASVGGGTVSLLFPAKQFCLARIISTAAQPIMIDFGTTSAYVGGSATNTLQVGGGHLQAASTTVAYDSGIYGCDTWLARGANATTTIQLTETR